MKKPGRWQGECHLSFSCKKAYTSNRLFAKIGVAPRGFEPHMVLSLNCATPRTLILSTIGILG